MFLNRLRGWPFPPANSLTLFDNGLRRVLALGDEIRELVLKGRVRVVSSINARDKLALIRRVSDAVYGADERLEGVHGDRCLLYEALGMAGRLLERDQQTGVAGAFTQLHGSDHDAVFDIVRKTQRFIHGVDEGEAALLRGR